MEHRSRVVPTTQTITRTRRLAAALGVTAALVGLAVFAGWLVGAAPFQSLIPGLATMKANTAVSFALLGAAVVVAVVRPGRPSLSIALAIVPLLVALATAVEYAGSIDLGIDQLLVRDPSSVLNPGRMSLATAIALALLAVAIIVLDRLPRVANGLGLGALLIAMIALTGYLYGVSDLFEFGPYATIAIHTAASLAILAVGVLLARPESGLIGRALTTGPGGLLVRRLLPPTLLVPIVLGFVALQGSRQGLYPPELAVAILAIGVVVVLRLVVFRTAVAVDAAELERRDAIESARLADERQRLVADTVADGIVTIDGSSRIQFANPAAARMFGLAESELVGRQLTELMPERFRKRHLGAIGRYIDSRTATFEWQGAELVGLRSDGEEFPVEVAFAEGPDPHQPSFTGVIRDISGRKRLEAQLLQAQRLESIGRLAGGVAHDFNNILTAIIGFDQLLLDQLPEGDPRRAHAQAIGEAADRAATLVRQLMAFGRQQVLHPEVIDVGEVVEGLTPLLERVIGEDVRLTVRRAPGLRRVEADRGQLEQVIVNLAANARDAMPTGGRLTIETANVTLDTEYIRGHPDVRPGEHVMIAVSDTGEGMDSATQARIFEPFFTTKGQGRGTGLGLATVYGIVRQSGGHIYVYSEPGQGATFRVYLPVATTEPVSMPASPDTETSPNGRETILLAEDDDSIRDLLQIMLRRLGYTVLVAADAEDALGVAASQRIDVLVSDVVLPGRSGLELAEDIRSVAPGVRVLLMSGYTAAALEPRQSALEGYELLEKPFTPEALGRAIRRVLANGSQADERVESPGER
jgi:two-component system cell cycle sensor histidine kinase/response regulator CckA